MTPEQKARIGIDKKLTTYGWLLQAKKEFNPAAAQGVVEAKKAEEGHNMTVREA